jgi:hypothetical protein
MVASIVNRGLLDEEFFFENSGAQWVVWERLNDRFARVRPMVFANLASRRWIAGAACPGSTEAMRAMSAQMEQAAQRKSGAGF